MGFSSFVGLRYLRSKKRSVFLSLITFFSITGVGLGVATLIVTLSVMDGFEKALKKRLGGGDFHILVERAASAGDQYFSFSAQSAAQYFDSSADIVSVNPVLATEAILRLKKRVSGVTLRGISESQMNAVAKTLVEAAEHDPSKMPKLISRQGLWLGKELSFQIGVLPGDQLQIISPTETEGPMESVPRLKTYVVEGIYDSGIPDKDLHVVYAPMESVREFLRKPNLINSVELRVKDFNESSAAGIALKQSLGPEFVVKDWDQLNAHLFASLKLERITMFVILTMIICVASFNVITSLRMNVIEKRKELSILQAMGATQRQIARIFFVQGGMIGLIGTTMGAVVGISIALLLRNYDFIQLPDIFYDRTLPVEIAPLYILGIVITALVIVLLAAISPARAAARVTPLEGIREV
jgi:lipoprotein-releasing system permease protein